QRTSRRSPSCSIFRTDASCQFCPPALMFPGGLAPSGGGGLLDGDRKAESARQEARQAAWVGSAFRVATHLRAPAAGRVPPLALAVPGRRVPARALQPPARARAERWVPEGRPEQ